MYKDILLAVDLVHESSWRKALPESVHIAQTSGSRIHLLTVVPDFGSSLVGSFFPKEHAAKLLEQVRQQLHEFSKKNIPEGIPIQHIVGHGSAYDEILHYARETKSDLIVIGSHRPEMQDYLLGPTAAKVVRHAKCSVLVVRD
jgi:nucleotide-binding universal stress UspA family protein